MPTASSSQTICATSFPRNMFGLMLSKLQQSWSFCDQCLFTSDFELLRFLSLLLILSCFSSMLPSSFLQSTTRALNSSKTIFLRASRNRVFFLYERFPKYNTNGQSLYNSFLFPRIDKCDFLKR